MKKVFVLLAACITTVAIYAAIHVSAAEPQAEPQAEGISMATPKANDTMTPEEFVAYLESCGKYFVATVDGDQPKVRPFSFCAVINNEVYFMSRKEKEVYKQLVANPKVQIAAFPESGRDWMRITCKLVEAETPEVRKIFLDKYPMMKQAHPLDDPNYAFMKLVGITAVKGDKVYSVK